MAPRSATATFAARSCAQIEQARLCALSQCVDAHSGRDGEQNVAQPHLLADRVARGVGRVVAPAGLVVGDRKNQIALEQCLDRIRGSLADRAARRGRILGCEQAGRDRSLPQQLDFRAAAQLHIRQRLKRVRDRHPVDGCNGGEACRSDCGIGTHHEARVGTF